MAKDVDNLSISGNLTADPKVEETPTGTMMAKFSIATNRYYGKDWVSFFNCVAWGNTAKVVGDYCRKGSKVHLTGEIKQDRWDKDGSNKSAVIIIVKEVVFGAKREQSSTDQKPENPLDGKEDDTQGHFKDLVDPDDIPF